MDVSSRVIISASVLAALLGTATLTVTTSDWSSRITPVSSPLIELSTQFAIDDTCIVYLSVAVPVFVTRKFRSVDIPG